MPIASEESEVDIEVEAMEYSSEEDDLEGKEAEELGEDELEDSDNEEANGSQSPAPAPLKIKLKLGPQPGSTESRASARRFTRPRNEDIESEDSDSVDSYTPAPSSNRQLTARQAVLASAVDPLHITLDAPKSTKKTQFTPTEVALRKEENARKRKNMIEKKLEDEKAETIHRLLKKQSRPKNKRAAAAPQSDEDVYMDEEDAAAPTPGATAIPMYRWVSTSRVGSGTPGTDPSVSISFSVPESFLPEEKKEVMIQLSAVAPSRCAVEGCEAARKYRAVGQAWGVGACGLGHLKILQGRS